MIQTDRRTGAKHICYMLSCAKSMSSMQVVIRNSFSVLLLKYICVFRKVDKFSKL